MADKGLLESARRMYGAKDAARQEAKKDMARSGEILYRGLRDFGVAKQREEAIRRTEMARQEAMDYRKQTFDQTMDFRQRQFDYTKELQNQKLEESRYLEEFESAAKVAKVVSGLENSSFFKGMEVTIDQNYDKLSALNEQKHNRSGDPRTIAKEYSDVARKFSDIATEYKVMTDIINTVTKENPQSGQMDLSIFSNEPGSQEALKNITTIIKGMRDGSVDMFGDDNGKLMVKGDFNEDGNVTTVPFSELKLQEYILKNNGKGPALDALYTTAYQNGMKGFSADAGLISSQIMNMLQDYDDKAAYDDFDPDFDGKNKTNFTSYYIPNLKDGTVEQGINERWGNAQNQWWGYQIESQGWTQVDNVKRDGVTETSWEDNDGNVYMRRVFDENEGISSWTKNGKRHWWHHDELWSGDDGIGISRKGLFAEWLGDLYAEGVNNNENVKNQIARKNNPGSGTDVGIANARADINTMVNLIEAGKSLEGIGEIYTKRYKGTGDKGRYSFIGEMDPNTESPTGTFGFYRDISQSGDSNPLPYADTKYTMSNTVDGKMELLNNIVNTRFGGTDVSNLWNDKTEAGQNFRNEIRSMFSEKDIKEVIPTLDSNIRKGGAAEVVVEKNLEKMTIANEQLNQIDVVVDKAISDYADNKNWKSIYSTINNYIIGQKGEVSAGEDLLNQWSIPASVSAEEKQSIENEVDAQIQTGFSDLDFGSMGTLDRDEVRKILTYVEYRIRNKK
ncbi:MAG: hypothetical protein CMP19_05725 [Rickettsiales bacterium]|nr:hypothetical protein [Rickettsiales bacterium]